MSGTAVRGSGPGRPTAVQATLEDLGTPLADSVFVVVDLETTGGSPAESQITEIGAVKVSGGVVLAEFHTLVDPGCPIPAEISLLTGISERTVAGAPLIGAVLPAFLEFVRGSVLVAHNAPFDVGFLRAACARHERAWPDPPVLDTARIARQVLGADEVRNRKLGTLARFFGSPVLPDHRALTDARATVDVLHGLIERVGNLGVTSVEELAAYSGRVLQRTRRKRHLADGLPSGPGVYQFLDEQGRVLYVGTSVDIRTRVRSYFTASEQRTRMGEMVALAHSVRPVPCATVLEARVRELRLIAEHAPRYNRRSRRPERMPWLKLTAEPYPRLMVTREVQADGGTYLGPFSATSRAQAAMAAAHQAFPIRQCTTRLPRRPGPGASACLLADLGRCCAPCVAGPAVAQEYAEVIDRLRAAMDGDPGVLVEVTLARIARLADQERFEEAAEHRDRMTAFVTGGARTQRLAPLAASPELLAAQRASHGGWELVLVRHGRLAGTAVSPARADPQPTIDSLLLTGEHVAPRPAPAPAAHPEETEEIVRWLSRPGVRLVQLEGEWSCPVGGAERLRHAWR